MDPETAGEREFEKQFVVVYEERGRRKVDTEQGNMSLVNLITLFQSLS